MSQSPWEYFTNEELTCHCGCGQMLMDPTFMQNLVAMREEAGFPFTISSGYRCPAHDANVGTSSHAGSGPHTTGRAVDITITGKRAFRLIELAQAHGMTGIGVSLKGGHGFIHLDDLMVEPRPNVWSY